MVSKNSMKIIEYLKENNGATAAEISEALGIQKRLVDSYFSAAVIQNDLGYRNEETPAKLILNDKGLAFSNE